MARSIEDFISPDDNFTPEERAQARAEMLELAGAFSYLNVDDLKEARRRKVELE